MPSSRSPRQGRAAIEQAAPGHVRAVRRLMFDVLSSEEADRLGTAIDKMLTRLSDHGTSARLQA